MKNYKLSEVEVISPVNNFRPICNHRKPICDNKPFWAYPRDELEQEIMKIKRTLREVIENSLGQSMKKYRKNIPLVIFNLYDTKE
jgi:hypothetical protein